MLRHLPCNTIEEAALTEFPDNDRGVDLAIAVASGTSSPSDRLELDILRRLPTQWGGSLRDERFVQDVRQVFEK